MPGICRDWCWRKVGRRLENERARLRLSSRFGCPATAVRGNPCVNDINPIATMRPISRVFRMGSFGKIVVFGVAFANNAALPS